MVVRMAWAVLLGALVVSGSPSCNPTSDALYAKLWDNFRDVQPLSPSTRTIYRSPAATATCDACPVPVDSTSATCSEEGATTKNVRAFDTTTPNHWAYADQDHWDTYGHHGHSECFHHPHKGTHPGESPIDFHPPALEVTDTAGIHLSPLFGKVRSQLSLSNNGHSVSLAVCDHNPDDCSATGDFGNWPKQLRGVATDSDVDEYYLAQLHFHWGSDGTKGSEHTLCGKPRAAEMHMVFYNRRQVSSDRNNPDSGTKLAVLGTFLDSGAAEDNAAFAPILDAVHDGARRPGMSSMVDKVNLAALLPEEQGKFYTYAGSLTTPPCSQQVSWFVFEHFQHLSDRQLELLRASLTPQVGSQVAHMSFKAVLFPFFAIFLGTATLHFLTRYCSWVPYTVAVMSEGILFSWFLQMRYEGNFNVLTYDSLKYSTDQWAAIDGHTLLYAFLPALLFGDAMGLNIHLFKQTFTQCLLLACPGVLIGTFLTGMAAYLVLPYEWPFWLCMAFGSILSATDPVAVVSMLKELGASPRLTMQITGEALMNDGTAIVIFNLFWAMYNENRAYLYQDFGTILKYFLRMAVAGPLLGAALGWAAYLWMSWAGRKHSHEDGTIQTSITLLTAYLSFFLGESEGKVSGVLCCVSAALVLAQNAWPIVNSHESLENVWHAIEYLGNTVLFFLAGVITQRAVSAPDDAGATATVSFTGSDYGYCFLFFFLMTGIRAGMLLLFYLPLRKLGAGTTPKDAAFMVWAGLRGAVGLALALLVLQSGGDQRAGKQVVFMVSGLAFMTLIFQGITCGPLLEYWRMLGVPEVKAQMLESVRKRVQENSKQEYRKICLAEKHDASDAVRYLSKLHALMEEEHKPVATLKLRLQAMQASGSFDALKAGAKVERQNKIELAARSSHHEHDHIGGKNMFRRQQSAEGLGGGGGSAGGGSFGGGSSGAGEENEEEKKEEEEEFSIDHFTVLLAEHRSKGETADPEQLTAMRETFYRIVRSEYWEMIETGHLPPGNPATQLLLSSIDDALDSCQLELSDITFVMKQLDGSLASRFGHAINSALDTIDVCLPDWVTLDNEVQYLLNFKSCESTYYVAQSYKRAHEAAQRKICVFFGDDPSPDTPEELTVCLESLINVQLAVELIETVHPEVMKIIKTKLVSDHILEIEHHYIHHLVEQGVLSPKEAEPMFAEVHNDGVVLVRERKKQASALVFSEIKSEMLERVPSSPTLGVSLDVEVGGGAGTESEGKAGLKGRRQSQAVLKKERSSVNLLMEKHDSRNSLDGILAERESSKVTVEEKSSEVELDNGVGLDIDDTEFSEQEFMAPKRRPKPIKGTPKRPSQNALFEVFDAVL